MVTAIDNALVKKERESYKKNCFKKLTARLTELTSKNYGPFWRVETIQQKKKFPHQWYPWSHIYWPEWNNLPWNNSASVHKVVELGRFLETEINEQDISIVHRLRKKKRGNRQMIVRFSRRITKFIIHHNNKILAKAAETKDVKINEDLRPHVCGSSARWKLITELSYCEPNIATSSLHGGTKKCRRWEISLMVAIFSTINSTTQNFSTNCDTSNGTWNKSQLGAHSWI